MKIRMMLASLTFVFGSGASADYGETPATVFLDCYVLYGTSENGVLRADFESGMITLIDASGRKQQLQGELSSMNRSAQLEQSGLQFIGGPLAQRGGSCSSQAQAVQAAVSLVQSACANGQSASCTSAISAMHDAYDAYATCLRHHLQQN